MKNLMVMPRTILSTELNFIHLFLPRSNDKRHHHRESMADKHKPMEMLTCWPTLILSKNKYVYMLCVLLASNLRMTVMADLADDDDDSSRSVGTVLLLLLFLLVILQHYCYAYSTIIISPTTKKMTGGHKMENTHSGYFLPSCLAYSLSFLLSIVLQLFELSLTSQ